MEKGIECKVCQSKAIKNGRSKNGTQRYYCHGCERGFQAEYLYRACDRQSSQQIVTLTRESCGVRSTARILQISCTTVIERIKKIGKAIVRPFTLLKGKEYEVDEMRTYIGNKKRLYWVAYDIRKDTKEVIDFRVGKRTMKTLQAYWIPCYTQRRKR